MSEYATTPTNTDNPIFDPRIYWRVSAFALTAVAVLGILVNAVTGQSEAGIANFLEFDWAHNVVHLVLAGAAFFFGFANVSGQTAKTFAIVFGFVYAGLGLFGLVAGPLDYTLGNILSLELGENLVHILLGAWALTAGFKAQY